MIVIKCSSRPRNNKCFDVVAVDKRKKSGPTKFLDKIGYYQPLYNRFKIDLDKIRSWVSKGAQISSRVQKLIQIQEGA